MIVTFQAQIDPLDPHEFSRDKLLEMDATFNEFVSRLANFREYVRGQMFVDGKAYDVYSQ